MIIQLFYILKAILVLMKHIFYKNQISRINYLGYVSQEQKLANEKLTSILESEQVNQ